MNDDLKKEAREDSKYLANKYLQETYRVAAEYWIDRATLAERKRCAEIAREYFDEKEYPEQNLCGLHIATAIEKGEAV